MSYTGPQAMLAEIERLQAALDNERANAEDPRQNCTLVVAENERLRTENAEVRHDIQRHVEIAGDQCSEIERLRKLLTRAHQYLPSGSLIRSDVEAERPWGAAAEQSVRED